MEENPCVINGEDNHLVAVLVEHGFIMEELTKKYPKCHHVQLDQNVILDKSIWT
jgi:hypothetical protein